ncbi:hypothetical protein [Cellulomonas sp. ATA003]|uniref:hypothetical protein n=1 Tax=Cellulomonas sp. ATA003 TaxID=3073064 RepID=UPI002872B943|nr:hypothetical protein [Cellulomonas sp. ATA003]WNB84343.1 hypothetical protein REH70_10655 [Cellulomonas sp. ATA003]
MQHINLSEADLAIVMQALNEVLHEPDAIEEWEFHTRMGADRSETRALLERIALELDGR